MAVQTPTIEIPRHPEESARAYQARVEYVTMGTGRSLDKLIARVRSGDISGIPTRRNTLADWSTKYGWGDSARQYDDTLQSVRVQTASEQYLKDLEEHRTRYQKAGQDLFGIAVGLLAQCGRAIRGERIIGKDGKEYFIPQMELTPTTLATATRSLVIAADLEAHALRLSELLPQLANNDS